MITIQADTPPSKNVPSAHWTVWLWFVYVLVPVLTLVFLLSAKYVGGDFDYWVLESPVGVRESATGVLALAAAAVGLVASFHSNIRHDWKLRAWLLLFVVGMIFFGGEDLNWGQYYFGWQAPEFFQAHNRELETNLHNMSHWFNQKPRLVAELWLLIAGILVPLGWRLPRRLTKKVVPGILWPDERLVFVSFTALLVKVPSALEGTGGHAIRWSEVQEVFFAYAWLIYALLLLARVRDFRRSTPDAAA